jgi:hypothetical protein
MPDPISGQKKPLTLTQFSVSSAGTITLDPSRSFAVMLNPAEFTHEYAIQYNTRKTLGQVATDAKFSAVDNDKVHFSIIVDGTGAVPTAGASSPPKDVKSQLADLNSVIYQYVGSRHEPSHVRVLWGTLIFFGRLESMSTQYTLFKPSGDPLRAKVDLRFIGFMSKEEEKLVANRSSPDLAHSVVVRKGDTLPLLCESIYGDGSYYPEVAQANDLTDFRNLQAGMRLHFPPLR